MSNKKSSNLLGIFGKALGTFASLVAIVSSCMTIHGVFFPSGVKAMIDDSDGYTNVRFGQGKHYPVVDIVTSGEVFQVIPDTQKEWLLVKTPRGKSGFIHESRVRYLSSKF